MIAVKLSFLVFGGATPVEFDTYIVRDGSVTYVRDAKGNAFVDLYTWNGKLVEVASLKMEQAAQAEQSEQ